MSTTPNPLMGWLGTSGVNQPGSNPLPDLQSPPAPSGTAGSTNPYGFGSRNGGALRTNLAESNLQTGLFKNALLPLFTNMMFSAGGDAGKFFKQLMDLGSPFYQQKQRASFEQGVTQSQNAAAQARQGLQASGAGSTPSGVNAAMMGGMGQAEAGNQAELFLNNLFQNEQLQMGGAQGLAQLAQLFNPAQLTGQQTNPSIQQPTNMVAPTLSGIGSMLSGVFGSGGAPMPK